MLVRTGAGDLEPVVRENRHDRFAHFDLERRFAPGEVRRFALRHDARRSAIMPQ